MSDPMSAENTHKASVDAAATEEQRADEGVRPEVSEATPDRAAELEAAVADLRDRLLRAHAEMENLRRRTEREVQDAKRYAVSGFARDLLGVADNLRRAIDAASPDKSEDESVDDDADPALSAFLQGVELTERELLKALEKNGVTKIDPKGQIFDPHRHEAVFEAPDPSVPAGTVVQVMQEGYMIGDRILRPAMVGVARGGPKPQAPVDKSA
ncbi:MAG: nucleotide exchange factor GrpE [Ancylobacter novellus]|uniref:Protein GrpE n=1 Tax=Ancylobacter novellus TaxID=921 RepID=A0A2W5MHZ1_ANCNO|nr:MAG: nucleotide exchange factor GrpE [Ancylobacter novellus]